VKEYVAASPTFPLHFERRTVTVPYRGSLVGVPVHLFTAADAYSSLPALVLSGGVDTWKMDLHSWCIAFAKQAGVSVLAFDHPGTGETQVPLNTDADEIIRGLVGEARKLGNGKVAHMGVSFGGNFAAMSGLSGIVDAAIVLGGPIDEAFATDNLAKAPLRDAGYCRQCDRLR
jgi:esterase FrsA